MLNTESSRAKALTIATVTIVIGIHIAGRVGAYCCPIEADDSYIFATFGQRIASGDVLYRDMSDIKPPGLFFIYALVYLIAPAARIWIAPIESAFLILGYYTIYRFTRERYGREAGLASAVVAALTINYFTVTGFSIVGFGVAENFMVFPAAAAALFYLRARTEDRLTPLLWCGLFMGIDTCIKQTALPLVIAIVTHWTISTLWTHRSASRVARGWLMLVVGGCLGWAPAIVVLIAQGTLLDAYHLLTQDASDMLGRSSALPTQWRDILPLCVPLAWGAWALLTRIETAYRRTHPPPTRFETASFLTIWCALEVYLLANLPLRSSHYFVAACVPFLLFSGAPIAAFADRLHHWPNRARVTAWSITVIASAVSFRSTVIEIVPRAIAYHHNYDWPKEARRFQEALNWGPIHFGRGAPFLQESTTIHPPQQSTGK